jgi:4'-phosphopantetheinyl transferase
MIHWHTQSVHSNEDLAAGLIPEGLLTPAEIVFFNRLKSDKRRSDWLLGRWTAKHLIQSVLAGSLSVTQIEILSEDDGAPKVKLQSSSPTISISHSHGHALCALVEQPGVPLGADIERIEARSDQFLHDYFVREEIGLVNAAPAQARAEIATAIWSAKESALKAIRLGFIVESFTVQCLPQGDGQKGWFPVVIEWDASFLKHLAPAMKGWWRVMDEFVLTLVASAEESYWPVNRA